MCCFNCDSRAAVRENKEGLSSEKARMTRARKKNLDGAIGAGMS